MKFATILLQPLGKFGARAYRMVVEFNKLICLLSLLIKMLFLCLNGEHDRCATGWKR